MKRLFFTFTLLPFIYSSYAQQYHPLVDSGAVWNQEQILCNGGPTITCDYKGSKYLLGTDTIFETVQYLNLMNQPTYEFQTGQGYAPYTNLVNYTVPLAAVGAIREDSSKKIWFRSYGTGITGCFGYVPSIDTDALLYDFDIQPGDTLPWTFEQYIVTAIDSAQLLNGEWRKQFHLDSYGNNKVWIEGIGSTQELFGPYAETFECGSNLTCYRKNGELLYGGNTDQVHVSCDSISVGIASPVDPNPSFEIFPNPATDFLHMDFKSDAVAEIKITNLLGETLFERNLKSGDQQIIPVKKFSGQMIICRLFIHGEMKGMKKVIVE